MPTTMTRKIGVNQDSPTHMDYTSLQSWFDACPANLVTSDQIWSGECYNQGEFTETAASILTVTGTTVDSTRYIQLKCAAGHSFRDQSGVRTTALAYNASNGVAIRTTSAGTQPTFGVQYTRVDGLQAQHAGFNAGSFTLAANTTMSNCLLDLGNNPVNGSYTTTTVRNCLIIANGNGIWRASYYNCTVIRSGSPASWAWANEYGSTFFMQNCAFFNFATLSGSGSPNAGSDYNATDLSTAFGTGTHNLNNLVYANQFVATGTDLRAVATGGLKAGTPDSTNSPTDISGFTRDATTPYIGAWEAAAAAGSGYTAREHGIRGLVRGVYSN